MTSSEATVEAVEAKGSVSHPLVGLLVDRVADYAIFALDPQGRVLTWNRGAERLKGYSAGDILGRHFGTFYLRDEIARGKPQEELRLAAEYGRFEDEGWRLRKDGTRFWANVVITALCDPETGEVVGFGKVTRDLTARRLAEESLRLSEERFRLLVDTVEDYAIFLLDAEGRIQTWNRGAERLKGFSAGDVVGEHFRILYPAEVAATGHPERELDLARTHGKFEEEGWRVRKDGTRFWANVVITALHDPRDERLTGFAKVTRDLTARRRAEEDLALRRVQLAQSDKLSALGMVISGVAHEVRTPLTYAINNLSLLQRRLAASGEPVAQEVEELAAFTSQALEGMERITRVMNELRRSARAEPGRPAAARVGQVVAQAVQAFELTHRSRVETTTRYDDDRDVVMDPIRIEQVALHLLENAAEAMPEGGRIRVETRARGAGVELVVADEGTGIPEHIQGRLFDPFCSTKPTGLGLGLSIVKRVVDEHEGTIRFRTSGEGTTFIVALPANNGSAGVPASTGTPI